MAIVFILFVITIVLCIFAYVDNKDRAKKKRELEQDRQRELEWEREAKQRQLEREEWQRQMEQEMEMSKQLAARRAAEPIIFNLTITEKDTNGVEIGDPKPLSLKLTLDEETATRLVNILRG